MTNYSDMIWQIATENAEATVHRVPLHGFNCTINRKFTMIHNIFFLCLSYDLDYTQDPGLHPHGVQTHANKSIIEGLDYGKT
jgi:hypothetical protein